jgi:hypothetical protein
VSPAAASKLKGAPADPLCPAGAAPGSLDAAEAVALAGGNVPVAPLAGPVTKSNAKNGIAGPAAVVAPFTKSVYGLDGNNA